MGFRFVQHAKQYENATASGRNKETRLCRKQRWIHETIQKFDGEQAEKRVTRYVYHRVGGFGHRCGLMES